MSIALLETMVNIILRTPWNTWMPAVDVGFDFCRVSCPFCEVSEVAVPREGESTLDGYAPWRADQLAEQKRLENPDNHDPDCLWRLAKEYRA